MDLTAECIGKSGFLSKFGTFQKPGSSLFCNQSYEKWVRKSKIQFSVETHSGPKCSDFRNQPSEPDGRIIRKSGIRSKFGYFPNPGFFLFFPATKVMKNGSQKAEASFQSKPIQHPTFRISGNNPMDLTADFIGKSGSLSKFGTFQKPGFFLPPKL